MGFAGSSCLWSGEPGLYENHGENPKVFGGSFKTLYIHVASLDKIRVSESTTRNPKPKPKRPHSRRWVYQCRCWFTLASGYDWRSLGGEGKFTWTVIANKSGVENKRNSVQSNDFSWWLFALWLQNVFQEIGKIRFNSVNSKKNAQKMDKVYKLGNWEKKRKRKRKHWYRGTCVHSK